MLNCARQHVQQFPPATIFCLIMMFANFTGKTFQCFAKIYYTYYAVKTTNPVVRS